VLCGVRFRSFGILFPNPRWRGFKSERPGFITVEGCTNSNFSGGRTAGAHHLGSLAALVGRWSTLGALLEAAYEAYSASRADRVMSPRKP